MNKRENNTAELNKQASDVLLCLNRLRFTNQRILAEETGLSLGSVNKSLKILESSGLINEDITLTKLAKSLIRNNSPKRAIILAAGFGMRMVPINTTTPKALLEVNGEVLIERQIRQLHEAGIKDITVVIGFMMESFEYLVDKLGVDLVVNSSYAAKNNIYSVGIVSDRLSNSYIVPCDMWCDINPFNRDELYSWYMVSSAVSEGSTVRVNRKN